MYKYTKVDFTELEENIAAAKRFDLFLICVFLVVIVLPILAVVFS